MSHQNMWWSMAPNKYVPNALKRNNMNLALDPTLPQ